MNITIHIPDNAVADVEEYCQRELGMSFQQRLQQEADRIIDNIPPLIEARMKETMKLLETISETINAE